MQSYAKLAAEVQTWTFSVKLKAAGYNYVTLRLEEAGARIRVGFDLTTGAVTYTAIIGTFVLGEAEAGDVDADGYRRYHITVQTPANATLFAYLELGNGPLEADLTFTGDAVNGVRAKEFQLRRGALGTYQATTTLRATTGILLMDAGLDFDGVSFTSRAERTGLAVIGQTRLGEPKSDIRLKKLWTGLWPKMAMIAGQTVQFYVGMQENVNSGVLWNGPFTFNPSTDILVPEVNIEGRLIALALETSGREQWRWDGYDIDVIPIGAF